MFDRLTTWVATCAVFLALAAPAAAQEISVSSTTASVGQAISIRYDIPETDPQPHYKLAFIPEGQAQIPTTHSIYRAGAGQWQLETPLDPGSYRAVLALASDHVALAEVSVQVVFAPTPGALTVEKDAALAHETVRVSVRVPEGRRYPSLWVGLFSLGTNTPSGGASIADERLAWGSIDRETGAAQLSMPRWPGVYELRLFERPNGPYVLDRARITVTVPPMPGVVTTDKEVYEAGETVTITVSPEAQLFSETWLELYQPGFEVSGGILRGRRLSWDWMNKQTRTWQLAAPADEGTYEVRLHEGGNREFRFQVAQTSFRVQVSPQPGAIKLTRTTFVIGERVEVPIGFDTTRGQYSPWVGLFDRTAAPTEGNAPRSVHRYEWHWVKNGGSATLTMPTWPGRYEFRLYDRGGRRYRLDTFEFEVVAPPLPEALALAKTEVDVGEAFTVTATLPAGRAYPDPYISITSIVAETSAGGAPRAEEPAQWNWVKSDTPVQFKGLPAVGRYKVRLYDRRTSGFLLDEEEFTVLVRPTPNAVTTDKDSYRTGEKIVVSVDLPAHRNLGSPFVSLHVDWGWGEGNAAMERHQMQFEWLRVGGGPYEFTAPSTPGSYELVATDRQYSGFELGRKKIEVVSDPANVIRINKRSFRPGETVRIQTRVPAGRGLYNPVVRLLRSSFVLEGGVLAVETPIKVHSVNQNAEVTFELTAPNEPGKYELRYCDRNSWFFVLDIEEFTVVADATPSTPREYARLTPMPGAGQVDPPRLTSAPATPATPTTPTTPTTPGAPTIQIESMTPQGMQVVRELTPGATFRVRVSYSPPPDEAPPTVSVAVTGGAAMTLPLRAESTPGVFVTDIIRVPVGGE